MAEGFKTGNEHTFRTDPSDKSSSFKTVKIGYLNTKKAKDTKRGQKRENVSRYLVLGFDTEYQAHAAVTKSEIQDENNKIHNEVLSYQYCIKIVSNDEDDPKQSVQNIIIPKDKKLLDLPSFIAFAVGDFIERHPKTAIPEDIYLVAHFTRADLPGFAGFEDIAKGFLSNIRNTFVSLGAYIPVKIETEEHITLADFKVRIRDTVLLAPANAKKLADVGEIVGFKKLTLGKTSEEDLEIKSHGMKQLRETQWETFKKYAIRDAEICVRYSEKLMKQNHILTEKLELPVTLTSFGTQMVQLDWKDKQWASDKVLGRETISTKTYNKRKGRYEFKKERPFIESLHYESALANETYHGGRNEQFMFGVCDEGFWRDHDLSSAYTTAMSIIGFPDWENITTITDIKNIAATDLAFFWVEFEFPPKVRFPTLPVRCDGGIIFPRTGFSKCAAPEIVLAQSLGATLKIKKANYVPTDRLKPIFKDFIVHCITNRAKFEKGTFDNLFWKEIGNSTYGKTAQGLKKKRVFDMRTDGMVSLPESDLTQPFIASIITSFTRAVLGEILNSFGEEVQVFSVTTDGFLSNASDEELKKSTSGEIYKLFEKARSSLESGSKPIEIKHEIRRPIGWRTRGSATLVPGVGANNYLLQKGGIKTDYNFDLKQENHFIIDLFLNRHPNQKLDYTIGIGLKDMIHHGADFVSRSITKRLSMEFDWKRKPINPSDTEFTFASKNYKHLSFNTVPLENKEEFDEIRTNWDTYTKGENNEKSILKTVDDLQHYENYSFQKKNPHGSKRRYISKTNADIKKLKTSLTRAFKQQQAGFQTHLEGKKITHKMFIEHMNECGIECKISDLDNAKRNTFEPHTAGFTSKAADAAELLKDKFYPDLDLEIVFDERYTSDR